MTIETKYNVGDEVRVSWPKRMVDCVVMRRRVTQYRNTLENIDSYIVEYYVTTEDDSGQWVFEPQIVGSMVDVTCRAGDYKVFMQDQS